jgi:2-desacetyl-2-hydroxyethyl bacteriochlorophyllide A dehydrogenase
MVYNIQNVWYTEKNPETGRKEMKAAVTTDFGKIEYKEVPVPETGDDEALIRVVCSGVCGTDVHVFQGHHPAALPPIIMGHEFSGTIEEIGRKNPKGLRKGDRVVVQPFTSCGVCEQCITGRENLCPDLQIFGIHRDGCFAEFTNAPVKRIFPIRDELEPEIAALVEPLAVALHDVRSSGMKIGNTALVIGGGPIGLLIAKLAEMNGASRVLVTELNPFRKKLLADKGFEVLDPAECEILDEVKKRTGGTGYDKVFEVSGTRSGTDLMLDAVKSGGTGVIVGIPTEKYPVSTDMMFKREITLRGVRIHSLINYKDAITLTDKKEIRDTLKSLISKEFSLSELADAIDLSIKSSEISKLIIRN